MAAAAAARTVLRATSARGSLMVLPPTIPASRFLTRRNYTSKVEEMPDIADRLAKLLKEAPTEANWSKAQALFEELSVSLPTKELVRLTTENSSAVKEFTRKLNRYESALNLNTSLISVMASIFAAVMLNERSSVNKLELRVDHLEGRSNKTDESLVVVDRKMYHHDQCFKRMEPKYHCPCYRVGTSTEDSLPPTPGDSLPPTPEPTPEDSSVAPEASTEDSSPDGSEGFFSWSWTLLKKLLSGH